MTSPYTEDGQPLRTRSLQVDTYVNIGSTASDGEARARADFEFRVGTAQDMADKPVTVRGTSKTEERYDPVINLPELGDSAYLQHMNQKDIYGSSTFVELEMRFKNVIISLRFHGYNEKNQKAETKNTSLDPAPIKSDLQQAAHEMTNYLTTCLPCRT
ncbi:hypothetical protein [Spirillospora sp. NBC_01491]|uniref:hypothetical protein n=1 Tax=Spirillospora sp. NBC_01491 TaxID=2976007 RepID=UPI002E34610F|nr:hypothetical protein [Spirillospora sp. NBC_01491]